MGVLRVYLAVCVFEWHFHFSPYPVFIFSFSAVLCFFIVSGFYMSMILNEKYDVSTWEGVKRFYVNRALRIFPSWYAVLAIGIILGFLRIIPVSNPFDPSVPVALLPRIGMVISQITLFPEALFGSISLQPGLRTAGYVMFGQMYTVGLELIFYMIAPLIVRRSLPVLVAFTAACGLVHYGLYQFGLPSRPWQYEFFPAILFFFMLGSLSYRLYAALKGAPHMHYLGLPVALMLAYLFWHSRDVSVGDFTNNQTMVLLYAGVTLALPFLFIATEHSRIDRWIGEISYPFYCLQYLVGMAYGLSPGSDNKPADAIALFLTIALSILIAIVVETQISPFRSAVAKNGFRATLRLNRGWLAKRLGRSRQAS
jgi:peptidoglycan/LPS O-acetylase OafA/YrhL